MTNESKKAEPSDQEIIDAIYPHFLEIDGGYACDTHPGLVASAVRALLSRYGAQPADGTVSAFARGWYAACQRAERPELAQEIGTPAYAVIRDQYVSAKPAASADAQQDALAHFPSSHWANRVYAQADQQENCA